MINQSWRQLQVKISTWIDAGLRTYADLFYYRPNVNLEINPIVNMNLESSPIATLTFEINPTANLTFESKRIVDFEMEIT